MSAAISKHPEAPASKCPPGFGGDAAIDRVALLAAPLRCLHRPERLSAPLSSIRGVGPKLTEAAARIGLGTLGDLIENLPHGYEDRAEPSVIAELRIGERATIEVEVRSARWRPTRRRNLRIVEASVADRSGVTTAIWFNQAWLAEKLRPGMRLILSGRLGRREFKVDAHEILERSGEPAGGGRDPIRDAPGPVAGLHTTGIVPTHPSGEGLRVQRLREWTWEALALAPDVLEPLPARLRERYSFAGAADARIAAHFPRSGDDVASARRRLAYEELFLHQAAMLTRRGERRSELTAVALGPPGDIVGSWLEALPFSPTRDQRVAFAELDGDLQSPRPMQRLLMGEVGSGKAQPMDALVLTPSGFKRMRELHVGGRVIAADGSVTRIAGVFPQGLREVWRIHFSDETSAECDREHLWQVQTSTARWRGDAPKVMTLDQIAGDLRRRSGAAKWHIELPAPADLEGGGERLVDPYLLGLLLGDGGLSIKDRVRFTSADPELILAFRAALPAGCSLHREAHRRYDWRVTNERVVRPDGLLEQVRAGDPPSMARAYEAGASTLTIGRAAGRSDTTIRNHLLRQGVRLRSSTRVADPLRRGIASLGLMGKKSRDKFVPPAYLEAPIEVRHAVLQGLMDTDGTLSRKHGSDVSFTSASQRLAEDVAWLVRSLGGRARSRARNTPGGTYWLTSIALPERFPPFRLKRKAGLLQVRTKYASPAKAIVDVERVGLKAVQCIAIEHPSKLYVTDGFTTTHNTVVALFAMLRALESGGQAALMAPTETLAEQHYATLERLLSGSGIPTALLRGSTPAAQRRRTLAALATGELALIVGTHALIEPTVEFARLRVAVIDEQHRFGVGQRRALDAKGARGAAPHVLHMTATPIPRTLSLTAYGDLDTTTLRELPAGRRPIMTWHVGEDRRDGAYGFIRERLREGRQAYVVCPLVSASEKDQAKAATVEAERLATGELRGFSVEVLHGQMPSALKSQAMARFASGEAQVLVATSVIEVGIDVANATVMLIEGADRYGLSQLHQLRGRIGRGEHESQCILFADPESERARLRLEAIARESDGFELAELDLTLRGEGEVLGTRQSGLPRFRVASLPADAALLAAARDDLLELLAEHGSLTAPALGPLMDAVRFRFGDERTEPIAA